MNKADPDMAMLFAALGVTNRTPEEQASFDAWRNVEFYRYLKITLNRPCKTYICTVCGVAEMLIGGLFSRGGSRSICDRCRHRQRQARGRL